MKLHKLIMMGKGVHLEAVAEAHSLHPNTVRKWCKRLHIRVGLMRTPESAHPRQALRTEDVKKFVVKYRQAGGPI